MESHSDTITRSRVWHTKCTRRCGAISALYFETPTHLRRYPDRRSRTTTDGDETRYYADSDHPQKKSVAARTDWYPIALYFVLCASQIKPRPFYTSSFPPETHTSCGITGIPRNQLSITIGLRWKGQEHFSLYLVDRRPSEHHSSRMTCWRLGEEHHRDEHDEIAFHVTRSCPWLIRAQSAPHLPGCSQS